MNVKKEYLNAYKNGKVTEGTVLFMTAENNPSPALKALAGHPHLREKHQVFSENVNDKETAHLLAEAEWIVSSVELPPFYTKQTNQNYLQILTGNSWNANMARLALHADYLVEEQQQPELANLKPILTATLIPVEECKSFIFTKIPVLQKEKKNIVMYCGGFKKNGVTTSALNLMHNLDKEKYQLIVIEEDDLGYYESKNFQKIPEHVVRIQIPGQLNIYPEEEEAFLQFHCEPLPHLMKNGLDNFFTTEIKTIYERELKRVLGNTKVDVALDFDGYFKYWTLILAAADSPKKIIFQHNEMMHEYSKKTGNKYKHRDDLNIIFPLYNYFDHVVSVAKHTGDVNKDFLKHIVKEEAKMTYVHNSIDYQQILRLANEESELELASDTFNFVTMGRLAPEKNHKMLIDAFQIFQVKNPQTKLYILGSGELEAELHRYVDSLGLADDVILPGQVSNPFPTLKASDAFVLSSIHEGQPMVLLESLVLGKPVLATNIPGCYSLLKDGYGLLVDGTTEAFAQGLEKVYNQEYLPKTFDYKQYNEEAVQMVENLLDSAPVASNYSEFSAS